MYKKALPMANAMYITVTTNEYSLYDGSVYSYFPNYDPSDYDVYLLEDNPHYVRFKLVRKDS